MCWRCLLLLSAALLAACAAPPTPFPVDTPATELPPPAEAATGSYLRYALGPSAHHAPIPEQTGAQTLQIELLDGTPDPQQLSALYDIATDYGLFPGATAAPVAATVSLVVNTELAPLDSPALADVVRRAVDPAAVVAALNLPGAQPARQSTAPASAAALRAQLANAGWPDGFDAVAAAAPIPGSLVALMPLRSLGIEMRPLVAAGVTEDEWAENRLHLALIVWYAHEQRQRWSELAGSENVIDLYTLPIGYIAAPHLTLSFTAEGWPVPASP